MSNFKQKQLTNVIVILFVLLLLPFGVQTTSIDIQVALNVLNLQSNGIVVTIHTDIAYWQVDASSVTLNGVEIDSWKSDDQGNFVAKFNMDEIKGLEGLQVNDYNTLTLDGVTYGGEDFTGSSEVYVKNIIPKGKK